MVPPLVFGQLPEQLDAAVQVLQERDLLGVNLLADALRVPLQFRERRAHLLDERRYERVQERPVGAQALPAVALGPAEDALEHVVAAVVADARAVVRANVSVRMWSPITRYAVSMRSSSTPP